MQRHDDRTNQILTSVASDQQFLNHLYDNAQGEFKQYLIKIFNAENQDGTLNIQMLRKNVNRDDYKLWMECLQAYEKTLAQDDEGQARLDKYRQIAGVDKASLLGAITGCIIAATAIKANNYLQSSMIKEYTNAFGFQEREAIIQGYQTEVQTTNKQIYQQANDLFNQKDAYGLSPSERIWDRSDKLNSAVTNATNKGLMRGLDSDYINNRLFGVFKNSKDSVATQFTKAGNFIGNVTVPNAKSDVNAQAYQQIQDNYQVQMANWNLASTHVKTDECDDLADAGPYPVDSYPDKPHDGCLCWESPAPPQ